MISNYFLDCFALKGLLVNVIQDEEVSRSYGLTSFPTLVLIRDGRQINFYSGPFTEELMRKWIVAGLEQEHETGEDVQANREL